MYIGYHFRSSSHYLGGQMMVFCGGGLKLHVHVVHFIVTLCPYLAVDNRMSLHTTPTY